MEKKMKSILFKSLRFKAFFIFFTLAVINTSFFISLVFENQVDLIADNSKFQTERVVSSVILSLKKYSNEIKTGEMDRKIRKEELAGKIAEIIKPFAHSFSLFTDKAKILARSDPQMALPKDYLQNAMKAVTNKEFSGMDYLLKMDENINILSFYIPLSQYGLKDSTLYLAFDIREVGNRLSKLYSQSFLILFGTLILFVIFALILGRMILHPIKLLSTGSEEITKGNLSVRLNLQRDDELGKLASSFNKMAGAIQNKVDELNNKMQTIEEAKQKIEELSVTDDLTQLYNRRYLFKRLSDELVHATKYNLDIGYLMIDIDHFKKFNDDYSHQVGDLVLREVSTLIKKVCRKSDIVARYGGEEIAVIAPNCSRIEIMELSEKIRREVERLKVSTQGGDLSVTVSIGATSFESDLLSVIGDPEVMIGFADSALYKSKNKGRNRSEFG
jgi:diguanylate cyclase (GGDEF)-like protein